MSKETKQLKYNTIALMIIQFLNYVLPFITLPYVARIFTVEKFGLIFYAQVLMDYFWRLVMFGFDLSGTRTIAINCENQKEINKTFNTIISIQVIFLVIGFAILTCITVFIPKFREDWLIYHLTYISLIGQVALVTWFYQGMQRMKFITILNIITRSLFLILIFIFIKQPQDYILYPLYNSVSYLIAGAISILFIKKIFNIKIQIPKLKDIWGTLKYSNEFFLTKIAIGLYRQTNAFVLGLLCTTTAVAYYVAADKIFWAVISLYLTFINALFPYMSKTKDLTFFRKMLKYLIILSIGASLFLLLASKYLILIFYSDKFTEAIKILQIFSISFAFYVFVDTLGMPLLGAFGYTREANLGYIIGGIYNVLGLFILYFTHSINIYSVAILVSSTYLIMFINRIYYIKKYDLLNTKEITCNSNN